MNRIQMLKERVKHLKVLFVDDENSVREQTGRFLRKFFDDVVVCCDGDEGLEMFLAQDNFDVVITDILMPKMDGMAMVKEIKKIKPNIFIVYLTASRSEVEMENILGDLRLYQSPLKNQSLNKYIVS